jgi:hypothetical protein
MASNTMWALREKDGECIYVLYDTALHEDRLFALAVSLFVGILVLGLQQVRNDLYRAEQDLFAACPA